MKKTLSTIHRFLSFRRRRSKQESNQKVLLSALLAVFWVMLIPMDSAAQSPSDQWQFGITPYFWAPRIDGTLKYGVPPGAGGSPDVAIDADDYLENLDFVFMIAGEARKGRWSVFTDVIYLDFSDDDSKVKSIDSWRPKIRGDTELPLVTRWLGGGIHWYQHHPKNSEQSAQQNLLIRSLLRSAPSK
jgi:hypothetical protein